jgi:glycosyltransferase involved in cell wall biosynthesis
MKLALFSTHPIQYQVPWFRRLAAQNGIDLKVYFAHLPDQGQQGIGFGVPFSWDLPLLQGYDSELLPNNRRSPRLDGFFSSSTSVVYGVLKKTRPDVAIITGWNSLPLLQALQACVTVGIPRVVRGESNSLRSRPWWTRSFHRLLLRRYDAFLAIGQANRDFYIKYGVAPERIFGCPYFVDNDRFQQQLEKIRAERDAIRTAWRVQAGHVCFLFAGKFQRKKRILDLLNAIDLARKTNPRIHLLAVGAGELMVEAVALAKSRDLPVTFAGFLNQTEITRAYAAADCLVLPSDYGETWGLVVNEAMACGLPAIVSDRVGCGPDLVEGGVTGAIFPFGDIGALADKILEMAHDSGRVARLGGQARDRMKHYTVDEAVAGTLRALEFAARSARLQQ